MTYKTDWVKCPICEEPDMRREWHSKEDGPYIHCTNLNCLSNGGYYETRADLVPGSSELQRVRDAMKPILDYMEMNKPFGWKHHFDRAKAALDTPKDAAPTPEVNDETRKPA
jgi:hypothetical protein